MDVDMPVETITVLDNNSKVPTSASILAIKIVLADVVVNHQEWQTNINKTHHEIYSYK